MRHIRTLFIYVFCLLSFLGTSYIGIKVASIRFPGGVGDDSNSSRSTTGSSLSSSNTGKEGSVAGTGSGRVLAASTGNSILNINVPTIFKTLLTAASLSVGGDSNFLGLSTFHGDATFLSNVTLGGSLTLTDDVSGIGSNINLGSGKITAGNIIYTVTAGNGIGVSGSQDLTITNSDLGSSQNIFKKIKVGEDTSEADSNTDTFELLSGSGISLSLNTSDDKLTITNSMIPGFTSSGSYAILSTGLSRVGIGTSTPSNTLELDSGTVDTSGFTFTKLTSSSTAGVGGGKVLSVDSGGKIILVSDQTGDTPTAESVLPSATNGMTLYFNGVSWVASDNLFHDGGSVGISTNSPTSRFQVNTNLATKIGAIIKGYTSQSANLQEWRNSSDTILSYIDSNGVFNGAANVAGSLNPGFTVGSIPFQGASGLTQDNTNLFWDNTNKRLGVRNASPGVTLHVSGNSRFGTAVPGTVGLMDVVSSSNANILQLWDDNNLTTPRFRFTRTGYLGIGINPTAALDVSGLSILRHGIEIAGGIESIDFSSTIGPHLITTAGASNLGLLPGGNVGIGTTSPGSKLDVQGGYLNVSGGATISATYAGSQALTIKGANGQTGNLQQWQNNGGAILASVTSTGAIQARMQAGDNHSTAGFHLYKDNNFILAIATDAPNNMPKISSYNQSLYINAGSSGNKAMFLGGSSINITGNTAVTGTISGSSTASISSTLILGGTSGVIQPADGPLTLNYKSGPNAWATAMTIQPMTGNVGIGTSNPTNKLEISGSTVSRTASYTLNGTTNGAQIMSAENTSYKNAGSVSVSGADGLTLKANPLGYGYGTVGSVGSALGNSGGSRNYIGVYGYGLLSTTALNNNDNRVAGGTFIAEMNGGGSAASSGSMFGTYTKADATGTTASAGSVNGLYSLAIGVTNQTAIGGYFSATGGTTNWGVYSAAGNNYFNGNVGIGTASPGSKFDVQGGYLNVSGGATISATYAEGKALTVNGNTILGGNTQAANSTEITLKGNVSFDNYIRNGSGSNIIYIGSGTFPTFNYGLTTPQVKGYSTQDLVYNTGGAAYNHTFKLNNVEAMRITNDLTVAIGTTTPTSPLHVSGAYGTNAAMTVNQTGVSGDIMTASASGVTKLQLSNAGVLRLNAYGAGDVTTDSDGNIVTSSDERLKVVQGSFSRGLSDILKLDPKLYKWNNLSGLETNTTYAGFIAQDVKLVIPEAVGTSPAGYLSLSDRPILAALVNAVKEQEVKINTSTSSALLSLGDRITNLESKVNNTVQNTDTGLISQIVSWTQSTFTFLKDILIKGRVTTEDRDAGGRAVVGAGNNKVQIVFNRQYETAPIINVTNQDNFVPFFVDQVSKDGFTINLSGVATSEAHFFWTATAVSNFNTTSSESVALPIPLPTILPTPEATESASL